METNEFPRTCRSGSEGDDGKVVVDVQIHRTQKIFRPIFFEFDVFKFPAIFAHPEIVVGVVFLVDQNDVDVDQLDDVVDDGQRRLGADDDLAANVPNLFRSILTFTVRLTYIGPAVVNNSIEY